MVQYSFMLSLGIEPSPGAAFLLEVIARCHSGYTGASVARVAARKYF